jgi:hypothetical protein
MVRSYFFGMNRVVHYDWKGVNKKMIAFRFNEAFFVIAMTGIPR